MRGGRSWPNRPPLCISLSGPRGAPGCEPNVETKCPDRSSSHSKHHIFTRQTKNETNPRPHRRPSTADADAVADANARTDRRRARTRLALPPCLNRGSVAAPAPAPEEQQQHRHHLSGVAKKRARGPYGGSRSDGGGGAGRAGRSGSGSGPECGSGTSAGRRSSDDDGVGSARLARRRRRQQPPPPPPSRRLAPPRPPPRPPPLRARRRPGPRRRSGPRQRAGRRPAAGRRRRDHVGGRSRSSSRRRGIHADVDVGHSATSAAAAAATTIVVAAIAAAGAGVAALPQPGRARSEIRGHQPGAVPPRGGRGRHARPPLAHLPRRARLPAREGPCGQLVRIRELDEGRPWRAVAAAEGVRRPRALRPGLVLVARVPHTVRGAGGRGHASEGDAAVRAQRPHARGGLCAASQAQRERGRAADDAGAPRGPLHPQPHGGGRRGGRGGRARVDAPGLSVRGDPGVRHAGPAGRGGAGRRPVVPQRV